MHHLIAFPLHCLLDINSHNLYWLYFALNKHLTYSELSAHVEFLVYCQKTKDTHAVVSLCFPCTFVLHSIQFVWASVVPNFCHFAAVSSWFDKLELSDRLKYQGWRCESDLKKCVVQAISFTLYSRGTAYMAASGSAAAINILWLDVPPYIFNKPITNMAIVVPPLKLSAVI